MNSHSLNFFRSMYTFTLGASKVLATPAMPNPPEVAFDPIPAEMPGGGCRGVVSNWLIRLIAPLPPAPPLGIPGLVGIPGLMLDVCWDRGTRRLRSGTVAHRE